MFKYFTAIDDDLRVLIDDYLTSFFAVQVDDIQDAINQKDPVLLEGILLDLFPKHLAVNKQEKCRKTIIQLYSYLEDGYHHEMNALFEYPIQMAFSEIPEEKKEFGKDFWAAYYPKHSKKDILKKTKNVFAYDIEATETYEKTKMSDKELLDDFIDDEVFSECCFQDSDVFQMEDLFQLDDPGAIQKIAKFEGVSLEYYFPLLPPDIIKQFKNAKKETSLTKKSFKA